LKIRRENSSLIKIWQDLHWRPKYIYDDISLTSSWNEKCFRQKL